MPASSQMTQCNRVLRVPITIPASTDPAANLLDLVVTELNARTAGLGTEIKPYVIGGRIGASNAAYMVGDDVTLATLTVGVGFTYEEPATEFLKGTWVTSSGGASNVVVSVYLSSNI